MSLKYLLIHVLLIIESNQLSYDFPLIKQFQGTLTPNNLLSHAEPLFENRIFGPSSLALYKNVIYAVTAKGIVYRCDLNNGNLTQLIRKEHCNNKNETQCGHSLGIRIDSYQTLYFVDSYLGLFAIELGNPPKVIRILSVEETKGKYMKHLAIDEGAAHDGGHVFYIIIASTIKDMNEWPMMILEPDRTGIVVKYDADKKTVETILNDLWFPMSVTLTDDRKAILVSEFTSRRITKYYIKGPQKGKREPFIENLPGECGHLTRSADKTRETYWIPIINARNVSNPSLMDFMSDKPEMRFEILDKYKTFGQTIEEIGQKWNSSRIEQSGFSMKTLSQFYNENVANNYGMILEIDSNGKIIGSLHSPNGVNSLISEVIESPIRNSYERVLYIGSFVYPFILRLVIHDHSFADQSFNYPLAFDNTFDLK